MQCNFYYYWLLFILNYALNRNIKNRNLNDKFLNLCVSLRRFRYSAGVSRRLCVCYVGVLLLAPPQIRRKVCGCVRPGSICPFTLSSQCHQVRSVYSLCIISRLFVFVVSTELCIFSLYFNSTNCTRLFKCSFRLMSLKVTLKVILLCAFHITVALKFVKFSFFKFIL